MLGLLDMLELDYDNDLLFPSFINDDIHLLETDDEDINSDEENSIIDFSENEDGFEKDDFPYPTELKIKEVFPASIFAVNTGNVSLPIFPPPAPPEQVELYIRRSKGDGYVKGIPSEISASPYKYVLKFITTLPDLYLRASNDSIRIIEEKRERKQCSEWRHEHIITCQFQIVNGTGRYPLRNNQFGETKILRQFHLIVLGKDDKVHFTSDICMLKSKRSIEEKDFWNVVDRKTVVYNRKNDSKKRKRFQDDDEYFYDENEKPKKRRRI